MKVNYTDITVILDRSGSMHGRENDVVNGLNKLIEDQRKAPGTATFSLVQFDDEYDVLRTAESIQATRLLAYGEYQPRGSTALHDAIGKTMVTTGERLKDLPEDERPEKVVLIVFTDGEENASKEYKAGKIKEMIEHQKSVYNWDVVFIGADQDAALAGSTIGLSKGSTLSYANTKAGTSAAYGTVSGTLTAVRSHLKQAMAFDDDERDKVAKEK